MSSQTHFHEWHCEECGEVQTEAPATVETYEGPEGEIELWFCEECTRRENRSGVR